MVQQSIFEIPRVKKLVESPIRPTIAEIGPIARDLGITSAREFWELFDKIQLLWSENRSFEGDWT
jgi:hypothetical protein